MPGKITRIAVTYTVDTIDGPRHIFHGLPHMVFGRQRTTPAGTLRPGPPKTSG